MTDESILLYPSIATRMVKSMMALCDKVLAEESRVFPICGGTHCSKTKHSNTSSIIFKITKAIGSSLNQLYLAMKPYEEGLNNLKTSLASGFKPKQLRYSEPTPSLKYRKTG